jgi:hypothetical protein
VSTPGDDFRQRLARVEVLVRSLEACPDPVTREAAREMVRALLDLHGAGLARILGLAGSDAVVGFAADELVSSLLLLHGLHPRPATDRVAVALDRARPRLRALGAEVALIEATEERVRMRVLGDPSAALRAAIEEAVIGAVPDLVALEIEAARDSSAPRIPLPVVV